MAERSYSTFKVRRGGCEEISLVQGKEQWLRFALQIVTATMKFQMFKLDLEKAEETEIKLPISVRSLKKQEISRKKTSTSTL